MKRKAGIILFGISFLVAILGEAYLLNVSQPHVFSIIGIGIVVILTGYLFFDSIWEHISASNKKKELLWDEAERLDSEKWDSRYTELLNIQKATYTALKKGNLKLEEDIKELSDRLSQIIQLQNKAIEGQKKALSISVNYSKEHTKELIEAIKEESMRNLAASSIESYVEANDYEKAESEIIPLYDDPNAALTADEIAKLFDSYGK
ncbi:MAG: hypothetical protein EWM47_08185 [Anaerolineaceae bacterium]|nr:MAG: hypothetical protein EWM47_08185 [Anaerolineaceae bacterium]